MPFCFLGSLDCRSSRGKLLWQPDVVLVGEGKKVVTLRFTLADGSVLMVYQTQLSGQTTITVAASAESADASVSYEDASTGETVSTNGRTFSADESDEITYDLVTQAG